MFSPYECRVVSKDGQIRWIVEMTTSIVYEGKRAVLGYYMDIDERKKLEWDVAKYKELDDLKKTLLSTVSHELRTPLSNIKGYANLLLKHQYKLSENDWLDFVHGIDKDTDRLTIFVNDLLNLSRLEAGLLSVDKKLRSINRLVKEVVSEARIRHPHHLITSSETGTPPRVRMDVRRIRQVLDNLIDNACKYSADGTRVKISARRTGSEILIGVSDQGIGIATEDLEKVFDPMYRIKHENSEKIPGIGLGLSVCKGLIDSHGGRIWIESEVGKGSTCWFTLPLDNANV
jgi:signal transduction histidine kinase